MTDSYRWQARRDSAASTGDGRLRAGMLALAAINVAVALGASFHAKGAPVTVVSSVPEVELQIGEERLQGAGANVVVRVPYGRHALTVSKAYHTKHTSVASVGWLSGRRFEAHIEPLPVSLTLATEPMAQVLINGQPVGNAGSDGRFLKNDLRYGRYTVQVRLEGFEPSTQSLTLTPPRAVVSMGLRVSAERAQQMERDRTQAYSLLNQAQQLYSQRQYKQAVSALDEALKLQPGLQPALNMKARVLETMRILNIR